MKTNYKIAIALVAGAAICGASAQGLHAQSKTKAYSIGEVEIMDAAGQAAYLPAARAAIAAAGGRVMRTVGGRVVTIEGAAPPKNVAIVEWDTAEQAVAFYKSKA